MRSNSNAQWQASRTKHGLYASLIVLYRRVACHLFVAGSGFDLGHRRVHALPAAAVHQHTRAGCRQPGGRVLAYAVGRTGHQGILACQRPAHTHNMHMCRVNVREVEI